MFKNIMIYGAFILGAVILTSAIKKSTDSILYESTAKYEVSQSHSSDDKLTFSVETFKLHQESVWIIYQWLLNNDAIVKLTYEYPIDGFTKLTSHAEELDRLVTSTEQGENYLVGADLIVSDKVDMVMLLSEYPALAKLNKEGLYMYGNEVVYPLSELEAKKYVENWGDSHE